MDDELEEIRKQKRKQLEQQLAGDGSAGDTGEDDAAAAPDEPVHVDGAGHLDELVEQYDVVLADFYADWCGPCKMLEPIVEELARETDAAMVKVDVDANQQLASRYGVRGVPTLILFADGQAAEQMVGVKDKSTLRNLIDQYSAA
jgi:thioredoxin 1